MGTPIGPTAGHGTQLIFANPKLATMARFPRTWGA